MNSSFSRIRQEQMLSGERIVTFFRLFSVSVLFILYLLLTEAGRSLQLRHLLMGIVFLASLGYSVPLLRRIRAGNLPAGWCHMAAFLDVLALCLFLGAFLQLPPGSGVSFALLLCATLCLIYPALALLRLLPANVVVAGGSATLGSAATILYSIVADQIAFYQILYLPVFLLPVTALFWGIGFRYTRLLAHHLVSEDVLRSSRRLRMTLEIVHASIFNLGQFVSTLERVSSGIVAGAQEQARSIDSAAGSAGKLQTSMARISSSTEISARTIHRTVDFSDNGNLIVHRVIDEILGIHAVVDQMVSSLELINDLADQTNLLALNAAIEASQAGQEGTGFTVIADEVRKLAERSARTAGEISKMVKRVEQVIVSGGESSKEAGRIFDRINKDLGGYAGFFNDLHVSVQEQLQANREVNLSIEDISKVITDNNQAADYVRQVIGELKKEVVKLKALVDGKIGEIDSVRIEEVRG